MNLHDIPDRPPTPAITADAVRRAMDHVRRNGPPRMTLYQEQFLNRVTAGTLDFGQPPDLEFRALEEHTAILRRLDDQHRLFQLARIRPDDLRMAAFVLTESEWRVLRMYTPWQQLQAQGFPMQEGVQISYRGFPVRVVPDWRDPLARR